jgi:hypothetical protein
VVGMKHIGGSCSTAHSNYMPKNWSMVGFTKKGLYYSIQLPHNQAVQLKS